jgi:hypothetical protein
MKRLLLGVPWGVSLTLFVLVCGCGAGDPTAGPGVALDGGGSLEGFGGWPDYGSPFSYDGVITYDTGGSSSSSDGSSQSQSSDGGSGGEACKTPPGLGCTGCPSGQICSAVKGGTCASAVVLTGPASNKAALRAVALAYVTCWNKAPSSDVLCATFDTCKMTGTITAQMVSDWVCNQAQVSDFPSSTIYDQAQSLVACSWYQTARPDWKLNGFIGGEKGAVCLSYDVDGYLYYLDTLHVNACSKYPPS